MKKTDMLFLEAIYLYTSANLSPSKQFVTVQIPKFLQYKIIGVHSIISLSFFIHQTIMIIEKRVKLLPLKLFTKNLYAKKRKLVDFLHILNYWTIHKII